MRQLFRFMFQHGSHLIFGAILMAMSSFGQTYFISLYGQEFRQTFDSAMADWAGCTPSAP
jgi:hypothetical protein